MTMPNAMSGVQSTGGSPRRAGSHEPDKHGRNAGLAHVHRGVVAGAEPPAVGPTTSGAGGGSTATSGSTPSTSPSCATTRIDVPRGSGPLAAVLALHSSPLT